MKRLNSIVAAALLALASVAVAQPGPPASMPRPGVGPGWRAGPGNTSGWTLMTPAERQSHHDKMAGMKSQPECRAYIEQHHADMVARAKERNVPMPSRPRGDACSWLQP